MLKLDGAYKRAPGMALRDFVEFLSSEVTPRKREHTWYEKCSNHIIFKRVYLQSNCKEFFFYPLHNKQIDVTKNIRI